MQRLSLRVEEEASAGVSDLGAWEVATRVIDVDPDVVEAGATYGIDLDAGEEFQENPGTTRWLGCVGAARQPHRTCVPRSTPYWLTVVPAGCLSLQSASFVTWEASTTTTPA